MRPCSLVDRTFITNLLASSRDLKYDTSGFPVHLIVIHQITRRHKVGYNIFI